MTLKRTFILKPRLGYLPGLGHEDDVDVTSFGEPPAVFAVEGKPTADDFVLAFNAWAKLGHPNRISVSVEAAA